MDLASTLSLKFIVPVNDTKVPLNIAWGGGGGGVYVRKCTVMSQILGHVQAIFKRHSILLNTFQSTHSNMSTFQSLCW